MIMYLILFFEWKPHCPKIRQIKSASIEQIRKKKKLREKFESIIPALKSFFLEREAVVKVDIAAMLKLITYGKSTNSSSVTCWVWLLLNKRRKSSTCPCIIWENLQNSVGCCLYIISPPTVADACRWNRKDQITCAILSNLYELWVFVKRTSCIGIL